MRYLPLLVLALLVSGCGRDDAPPRGVAVTLPVLADIVRPLLPEDTPVIVLLPPGASPHGFEPSPSVIRSLARSRVLVRAHPEVDGWMPGLPGMGVVTLSDLLPSEPQNPHLWLDPRLVGALVPDLVTELCSIIRSECGDSSARIDAFLASLDRAEQEVRVRLAPIRGEVWVVSAPFLDPFLQRFGIVPAAVIQSQETVEPGPSTLSRAIVAARSSRAVIGQSRLSESAAQLVASEAGRPLILIDPIGLSDGGGDYASFLLAIADSLAR